MTNTCCDVTAVWTPHAFAFAVLVGLAFGYAMAPRLIAGRSRRNYGWWVAVFLAAWITAEAFSQVFAGITTGDQWVRILSRLGPYLAGAAATGVGVYLGRPRDEGKT